MKDKKIETIVFFKFNGEQGEMRQATIFYTDGTVKMVSYDEGIDACEELVKEKNITSVNDFKNIINNEYVHVLTGREFTERYQEFMAKNSIDQKGINDIIGNTIANITKEKKQASYLDEELRAAEENLAAATANFDKAAKTLVLARRTDSGETQGMINQAENAFEAAFDEKIAAEQTLEKVNKARTAQANYEKAAKDLEAIRKADSGATQAMIGQAENAFDAAFDEKIAAEEELKAALNSKVTSNIKDEEEQIEEVKEDEINLPANEKEETVLPVTEEEKEDESLATEEEKEHTVLPVLGADDLPDYDYDEDIDEDELEEDDEDDLNLVDVPELEEPTGIKGWFAKSKNWLADKIEKIKKSSPVKKLVAVGLALAVGLGLYSCSARQTKSGKMLNANIDEVTATDTNNTDDTKALKESGVLVKGDNNFYDSYSFKELVEVTTNQTQKTSMQTLENRITEYNGTFANAHIESGKNVKAALTFDEMVALQQAYNDYSKDEIKAYFNGTEISAAEMEKDYKSGTLQLMGAHVIETRENPVDMSGLLKDEKSKEFYKKYHEMFLNAKTATGEDKKAKVKILEDAVRADFPITKEVRTEGIMHRDDYDQIESYKLSVVPMIAASEMLFQNLDVDFTLNDGEIDFLNDIGLCNYAQDKFEKIETITLSAEEDNTNPLYDQYREAVIKELKEKNQYVTDDKSRDLSSLDAFKNAVNWHFKYDGEGKVNGVEYTTQTYTTTNSWQETSTSYREETTRVEKPIPAEEKQKIDAAIAEENQAAKEEAEKEAEETRKDMQDKADADADKINDEIQKEEEDLQDKIDDANNQIDDNNKDNDTTNDKPVNEDDFGDHNVDFDDNHSDSNGNLDNSVEDITTDPSGDQTGEELPDPNVTGSEFDNQAPEVDNSNTSNQNIYEYEEPISNEELVNQYVEGLAETPAEAEAAYVYTK